MHVAGTAGHVDHGKSTLVRRLTGTDPDRWAEEKRRGLTIDLGFALLPLPSGRSIGVVDVPGHERFIKNMLAGAGGITIALFVVAANEGWMPQSEEHLAILNALEISSGVIAVTKADAVEGQELSRVLASVEGKLTGTTLEGSPIVACSALTGRGIDRLLAELDSQVDATAPAPDQGRPRLWLDRVFTIGGAGTVVTGTLAGGSFETGQEVAIAPEGGRPRIRSIQTHNEQVTRAEPGNRVALNLGGLRRQGAARGDAVVRPGGFVITDRIDVALEPQRSAPHDLTEKGSHLLFVGSAETQVKVRLLDREEDGPRYAQLVLAHPLPLQRGDRFVLRDAGRSYTWGGGRILDPAPSPLRKKRDEAPRRSLLRAIDGSTSERALLALLDHHGQLDAAGGLARSGLEEVPAGARRLGALLVSHQSFEDLSRKLRSLLEAHHEERPWEPGMDRASLRASTEIDPGVFDDLLPEMDDVVEEGSIVRLTGHRALLTPQQRAERERILGGLEAGGFSPPAPASLTADAALLRILAQAGDLVPVADFFLTSGRAEEAKALVAAAIRTEGALTVARIRDLLGTTRRYAVPLCEWLDATGVTRRRGDVRELGPPASER